MGESLLADLEELSGNEEEVVVGFVVDGVDLDGDTETPHVIDDDLDFDSVSRLHKTRRYAGYADVMEALERNKKLSSEEEYNLVVDCSALCVDTENEIANLHNFIRDKYGSKFPELESLVHDPVDYARIVQKIGNETDLTLVDLQSFLPSAIIMVVSITASTTTSIPLPDHILQMTVAVCDHALSLNSAKKKVVDFVETRMRHIAPNLSAVVGTAVAAKLMGAAGGLAALANMPACNVQLLGGGGGKRNSLAGFSIVTARIHAGYIEQTELFQSTPPCVRMQVCRKVATKSMLAARVDSVGGDLTGKVGRDMREEIRNKIEKLEELPPARQQKALPVRDMNPKKKRGGRRMKKMKERYAVTDMRKLVNRVKFGV